MRVQYSDVVLSARGVPQPNVIISIVPVPGTTATSKLWSEETGTGEVAVVMSNSLGIFSVWLDEGRYDIDPAGTSSKRVEIISQSAVEQGIRSETVLKKQLAVYPLEAFESIQAAINYCHEHGEGVVVFPSGATPVSEGLQMKQGVILKGPDQEYSVNNINRMAGWLAADASSESPIIEVGTETFNTGIWDLGISGGGHSRQAIVYPDSNKRGGNRIRNVALKECGSADKPALYLGQDEVRCRDVLVQNTLGDGIEIKGEDCQIDDLLCGECVGNGVVIPANVNNVRGAKWDIFTCGLVGFTLNGILHRLTDIQVNGCQRQGVVFEAITKVQIGKVIIEGNGREFSTSGIRYADVEFAHPTGGNIGCGIIGGTIATFDGMESFAIASTEPDPGFPAIIGVGFTGTYDESYLDSSNYVVIGCTPLPNLIAATEAKNPAMSLRPSPTSEGSDLLEANDGNGNVTMSITSLGALCQSVLLHELKVTGALPGLNAKKANTHVVTLEANATSSSITEPTKGETITIEWIQDATGNRTYKWPVNCKFAGGAAPAPSKGAGEADSVTFRYDGANWRETARAVGVK